ncbi:MAG: hypothetical protein ABR604_04890, partial [Jatrophihabitantaceae bacterium]
MAIARVLSSCAAAATVVGCAALVVSMSSPARPRDAAGPQYSAPALTVQPQPPAVTWTPSRVRSSASASAAPLPSARPRPTPGRRAVAVHPTRPAVASTVARPAPVLPVSRVTPRPTPTPTPAPAPAPTSAPTLPRGQSLPISGSTLGATRLITVTAASQRSTTAILQAWTRAAGGGWLKHGPAIFAHTGVDGLSETPSEWISATPIGSFTITQAFGRDPNPGTSLPYTQTTPADWWISEVDSPLYNTRQRCSWGCSFTLGAPNEHLYYVTPYYNYSLVIDYNTRNAPGGVRPGAGSAVFLH